MREFFIVVHVLNYKIIRKLLFITEFGCMKRIRLRNPAEFASEKECFIFRLHAPCRNSTEQRIHTVFFHHCAILRNHTECEFMKEFSVTVQVQVFQF